jgi:GNAT superfamily N-acetyltransferase
MATSMEFYVLREDSEIIAVGSFSTRDETTAWIPVMYVRSDFQRKGIGSDLLQFLEEIARGRNFMNINLETDNAAYWAVNFYEKHGYTTFKKDPNPWGHHIWMKKQL